MVWEEFVPVAAPDHPPKLEVASGVAVKTTVVPDKKTIEQVEPQLRPPISEFIVPLPEPDLEMVSVYDCAFEGIAIAIKHKNKIHGFIEFREFKWL